MAKEAALIEAMERKLRGGGGVALANEERQDETPESVPGEEEEEEGGWTGRNGQEWSEGLSEGGSGEGEVEEDLGFMKNFDYSAEAARIAAMEQQLRQLRGGGQGADEVGDAAAAADDDDDDDDEGAGLGGEDDEEEEDDDEEEEEVGEGRALPFDLSTYLTGPRATSQAAQHQPGDDEAVDERDAAQSRSLEALHGATPLERHHGAGTPRDDDDDDDSSRRRRRGGGAPGSQSSGSPLLRRIKGEERAVRAIQAAARGRLGRQRVAVRRRRQRDKAAQHAAAARIQAAERRRQGSELFVRSRPNDRAAQEEDEAVPVGGVGAGTRAEALERLRAKERKAFGAQAAGGGDRGGGRRGGGGGGAAAVPLAALSEAEVAYDRNRAMGRAYRALVAGTDSSLGSGGGLQSLLQLTPPQVVKLFGLFVRDVLVAPPFSAESGHNGLDPILHHVHSQVSARRFRGALLPLTFF
jgi:hypothetical protein